MVEKTIELTGSSATSIEDAVSLAVERAAAFGRVDGVFLQHQIERQAA